MNEENNQMEKIELDGESPHQIIIYCHQQSNATININAVHHHCPEWLDINGIIKIIRELKESNN